MDTASNALSWSSQLIITPRQRTPKLPGDKIILPPSALEQLLAAAPLQNVASQDTSRRYTTAFDPFNPHTFEAESRAREQALDRQHQLPHPLTFRIVNPQNGRVIYAGIREFSAMDNEIGLSDVLRDALGIEDSQRESQEKDTVHDTLSPGSGLDDERPLAPSTVTIHAQQLPKGTYVRLRPLEAGYDVEDWKALLERHLRDNYTTLTTGEVLTVLGGPSESFRFLVDKVNPEGEGICVVDTDLEVDIVALNDAQARETLRKKLEKPSHAPGGGSSMGGLLTTEGETTAQVVPGEYVDYELRKWDREKAIVIELVGVGDADFCLLASPLSTRQRNRPREDEHVFGNLSSQPSKTIDIQSTNMELQGAEALYISVHAFAPAGHLEVDRRPLRYTLRVTTGTSPGSDNAMEDTSSHDPGDAKCSNCNQWVPQRSLILHENFCFRNNEFCAQCQTVFQKKSDEWQNHWHCPYDSSYGNDSASKDRHDSIFHTKCLCRACNFEANGLPQLARHRTTDCPAKPILCQFCHLVVPQQGETDPSMYDPEVLISGLTPHEVHDGGRTTECHLCDKIVRLRDMQTHFRHHDLRRLSRPTPRICLNQNCGRTLDARGMQSAVNPGSDTLGLCSICFGPLYVDTYDPEGKALRRRIERRYLSQMMTGCGKFWCQNEYCKTGTQARQASSSAVISDRASPASLSAANILAMVRPLIAVIDLQSGNPTSAPFYFCTDQVGQQRRVLAEMLAAEDTGTADKKTYELSWCIAAVEATSGDINKSREWLENWAPAKGESTCARGT